MLGHHVVTKDGGRGDTGVLPTKWALMVKSVMA